MGVEGDGGYRLVLMQLPGLGSLEATDQIVLALEDGQGNELESLDHDLTPTEISRGLVQLADLQLAPQMEVDSVLDFGAVYAGLANQRQLEIRNSGSGPLVIEEGGISGVGLQ